MAVINGTNVAEPLNGSAAADNIYGFGGDDTLMGLAGADTIEGGEGNDVITGGADVDSLVGGAGDDSFVGVDGADVIDGGEGNDTVSGDLAVGVDIAAALGAGTVTDVEYVTVTNYDDYMLDLSADAQFGMAATLVSADGVISPAVALDALDYTASSTAVAAFVPVMAEGLMIGGETYADGDTLESAMGGTIAVTWNAGVWELQYTPDTADGYVVGDAAVSTDDVADTAVEATMTNVDGETVTVSVALTTNYDADFDATAATAGITSKGDTQANTMTGSNFADTIWAGADDEASDTVAGLDGDDILAGGGGADVINGGDGADTVYGGTGADALNGAAGDDVIWAGEDDDTAVNGGAGNDTIGGGEGADTMDGGDGDDMLFAGSSDDADNLTGGAGADTIYAGAGVDVIAGGDGDDLIFNGAGNDGTALVAVAGGAGADTLWGGAGNDILQGDDGVASDDDVFAFASGNGNDTIIDFELEGDAVGEIGDVLDLSAFNFADTSAVLAATTDDGTDSTIFIAPGQTITLEGVTLAQLQAATDDWVTV